MTKSLVDTGPLVAMLNERDSHHRWITEQFAEVRPPLLTCEAVLSEAFFLLRKHAAATDALVKLIDRKIVSISFQLETEFARVRNILNRYADIQISLADACLIRMTEVHSDCRLFTFDSDFQIYRRNGRQVIPVVGPTRRD